MRIYEGSPRQDFEEVLRSVGADLDARRMREILVLETPDAIVVQGLEMTEAGRWSDEIGRLGEETLVLGEDDLAARMDAGLARRGEAPEARAARQGYYEGALRVLGRYLDAQGARDVFLFEQGGAFVLRYLTGASSGHELVEFTRDEVETMVAAGPTARAGGDGAQG